METSKISDNKVEKSDMKQNVKQDGSRRYSIEAFQAAVKEAMKENEKENSVDPNIENPPPKKSLHKIAKEYDVPYSTLRNHVLNPNKPMKKGPPPTLSPHEENALVAVISNCCDNGWKISQKSVVQKALAIQKVKTEDPEFINKTPITKGRSWIRGFRKRHEAIVMKKPEKMDPGRLDISLSAVEEYYENIRTTRLKNNIPETRIYNADETGIPVSPEGNRTLSIKGEARFVRAPENNESLTMMVTIGSDGTLLPPLFLYRGKTFPLEMAEGLPPSIKVNIIYIMAKDIAICPTPKGFMKSEIYGQWVEMLIKQLKVSLGNPALLILDAHASRENLDAILLAKASGLHIILLPGKMTSYLQPLDKAAFTQVKSKYEELMLDTDFSKNVIVKKDKRTKWEVINIAYQAAKEVLTPETIKNAFLVTSIEPFTPTGNCYLFPKNIRNDRKA